MSCSTNTTAQRRSAELDMRKSFGCRTYTLPARCPKCGTKNAKRRRDRVCYGCSMKERYGE